MSTRTGRRAALTAMLAFGWAASTCGDDPVAGDPVKEPEIPGEPGAACSPCNADRPCNEGRLCAPARGLGDICVLECDPSAAECPDGFECTRVSIGAVCLLRAASCCVDWDGDGNGEGVDCDGLDCDDTTPLHWDDCGECADLDGDGRGVDCNMGSDCDETEPLHWSDCGGDCVDIDGDGRGTGCDLGTDCDDTDSARYDDAEEICDGIDNDCDGLTDIEQRPHGELCPPGPHSSRVTCSANACRIGACDPNYWDTNGAAGDGCECMVTLTSGDGDTCETATDLGALHDDAAHLVTHTAIVPSVDQPLWFRFQGVDDAWDVDGCDAYDIRVELSNNPGNQLLLDIYRGGCDRSTNFLGNGTEFDWFTNFHADADATGSNATGECECTSQVDAEGNHLTDAVMSWCTDNTADFYLRVHFAEGVARSCDMFEITVSNGAGAPIR